MGQPYPHLKDIGVDGIVARFSDRLGEPANRAALAFRAAVQKEGWDHVRETATALTSAVVRFDPLRVDHDAMRDRLQALLASRDWLAAQMPAGRRHWVIPVALGGTDGPQFSEAAALSGQSEDQAAEAIAAARVRVLTLGFAPGQPYMGELPRTWDIPRQTALTKSVPGGALVVAIRQLIIFAGPAPTG